YRHGKIRPPTRIAAHLSDVSAGAGISYLTEIKLCPLRWNLADIECIRVNAAPTREVAQDLNLEIGPHTSLKLKSLRLIEIAGAAVHSKGVGSRCYITIKRCARIGRR